MSAGRSAQPGERLAQRAARARVRLVDRATDADPAVEALRGLARALAPYLREVLATDRGDDDVVDVATAVPLPKRLLFAACRRGEIVGAARKARRWYARRADVLVWLRARGPTAVGAPREDDGAEDDLEETRRSLLRPGTRGR
jgi:hypothetical protein